MNAKCFLDTNILVYLFDKSEPDKRRKVKTLLAKLQKDRQGYISAQVVNAFIVIVSQKISHPIPLDEIAEKLLFLQKRLHISSLHIETSLKAIEMKCRYGYSFWDSLIIASALENNCSVVYSEDMHDGQVIEGTLAIRNPLRNCQSE